MIGAREDPDVAGDSFQKLNLHQRTAAGDEVARGDHQIARGNRREELRAERIARARRQDQVGRSVFTLGREQLPVSAGSRNPRDAFLAYIDPRSSAGAPGSLQQQSIQRQAREDRDRVLHVEAHPLPRRTDQLAVFNRIAFAPGIRQKRILLQSFVRESAAAGLLPGKLFVKEKDVPAARCQQRAGQSARWTASDNRNGVLRASCSGHGFCARRRKARQRAATSAAALREFSPSRGGQGLPRIRELAGYCSVVELFSP